MNLDQSQIDTIIAACQRHHVASLHAFGSALRSDYRPGESDIDLLVEFQPLDAASLYRTYFALLNELPPRVGLSGGSGDGRCRAQSLHQEDDRSQQTADLCSVI